MRGTLEQFIPADYYKTEEAFLGRVEEEADMFRPFGEKVYSYTRMAPGAAGKGKGVGALDEADADAVVFEVWHVSWYSAGLGLATGFNPLSMFRPNGTHMGSRNTIDGCSFLSCSISKQGHISKKGRNRGSLSSCRYLSTLIIPDRCPADTTVVCVQF